MQFINWVEMQRLMTWWHDDMMQCKNKRASTKQTHSETWNSWKSSGASVSGRYKYEHPGSTIGYWPEMCLGHVYIVHEPVGSACLAYDDDIILYELCGLVTECCSEFRLRSQTWRGVSKWSRHKDQYIGQLYFDFGMVPGEIGILPEYREVTGTPPPPPGSYMGLSGL